MTARPLCPCRQPGCPQLVPQGYCEQHRRMSCKTVYDRTRRRTDPALATAARIRNSSQWAKVRALHKRIEPLCRDPFGDHNGFPVPTADSHHIQPLSTHPHLAFTIENLAALCEACHRKVEAMERKGESTARLFNANISQ